MIRWRTGNRRFLKSAGGSVTVEFVVTFPLLLAALAFAFEFGRFFLAHHETVNNVREAARYLSRGSLSATQVTAAEQIVKTGVPSGGTEPGWMAGATVVVDTTYSSFSDTDFRVNGQVVRVRATVNFPLTIFGFIGNDSTAITFAVVDDVRHIGD